MTAVKFQGRTYMAALDPADGESVTVVAKFQFHSRTAKLTLVEAHRWLGDHGCKAQKARRLLRLLNSAREGSIPA